MTKLSVVSALSVLPTGRVDLGEQDLKKITVGDVKLMLEGRCEEEALRCELRLWWQGFLLDFGSKPVHSACVELDPGQISSGKEVSLTLFLTAHNDQEDDDDDNRSLPSLRGRLRSNSFADLVGIAGSIKQGESGSSCTIV